MGPGKVWGWIVGFGVDKMDLFGALNLSMIGQQYSI